LINKLVNDGDDDVNEDDANNVNFNCNDDQPVTCAQLGFDEVHAFCVCHSCPRLPYLVWRSDLHWSSVVQIDCIRRRCTTQHRQPTTARSSAYSNKIYSTTRYL